MPGKAKIEDNLTQRRRVHRDSAETGVAGWSGEMGVELSNTMLRQKYGTCQETFERNLEVV